IAMCVALVVLVVWTLVSISTMERIPEYAKLEAMGYDKGTLRKMLSGEIILVSTISTLISIIPAIYFGYLLLPLMDQTLSVLKFFIDPYALLVSCIIPIVTAIISIVPTIRKMEKLELANTLKISHHH
ncbi:MAG: FtsX-like permease family protein, partial [Candidatus Thorarchaeota archaeon]